MRVANSRHSGESSLWPRSSVRSSAHASLAAATRSSTEAQPSRSAGVVRRRGRRRACAPITSSDGMWTSGSCSARTRCTAAAANLAVAGPSS
eukprot:4817883-Prymnesium_polylepis.1